MSLRDQAAIAGIGITELSKNSGVSTMTLAQRAILVGGPDFIPSAEGNFQGPIWWRGEEPIYY